MSTLEDESREASRPGEATAANDAPRREQFIPLRKAELAEILRSEFGLPADDAGSFRRLARLLHAVVDCEYQQVLERLKHAYAPFDPDTDTQAALELPPAELDALRDQLFREFGRLLERGNFIRLAQAEIDEALRTRSHWGLHLKVNFELFERLELYYRGDTMGTRYRRSIAKGFRPEEIAVPIYQRLVVIFRLRPGGKRSKIFDTQDVYLKLFKEIPKVDLDMLLPGTSVRMSLVDRVRFMLPTLTGVGIVIYKFLAAFALTFGSTLALLGLAGGTVGYGVRSLYGYLNTKQKYQLNLTQSLYYQNIDNNAGVIHRLLDEADEQENREVLLAYFFLWQQAPAAGWTGDELDAAVEAWLHAHTEQAIDFEIGDALEKLDRFGLAVCEAGRYRALPIAEARQSLERFWSKWPETLVGD